MKKEIAGYHLDEENHWVVRLQCRHQQHVRHDPPLTNRPWVLTQEGRDARLGYEIECKKCDEGKPRDW